EDFFFSSGRRHTRFSRDWSSDVCSSDLAATTREDDDVTHAGTVAHAAALGLGAALGCGCSPVRTRLSELLREPRDLRARETRVRSEERRVGKEWSDRGAG